MGFLLERLELNTTRPDAWSLSAVWEVAQPRKMEPMNFFQDMARSKGMPITHADANIHGIPDDIWTELA